MKAAEIFGAAVGSIIGAAVVVGFFYGLIGFAEWTLPWHFKDHALGRFFLGLLSVVFFIAYFASNDDDNQPPMAPTLAVDNDK